MKYKLLKKIEGLTIGDGLQVGDTFQDGTSVTFLIGKNTAQTRMLSPLDLHNLLLNGTIEKVEEVVEKEYRYFKKTGKIAGTFIADTPMEEGMTNVRPRWRAEDGGKYYFIAEGLYVDLGYDRDFSHNEEHFDVGNYFRTEQEAQQVADQIKELLKKHP